MLKNSVRETFTGRDRSRPRERDGSAPNGAAPSRCPSERRGAPLPHACIPSRSDRNGRPKEEGGKLRTCIPEEPGSRSIASLKKTLHFPAKFRYRSIEGFPPRIDDDGPLWAQLIEMQAHGLADPSLDAISHHCFAEGARTGEADMGTFRLRFADTKCRKQGPGEAGTLVIYSAEVFGTQQTDTFRKTRDGVLPLGANGQFLAAACAATGQNGASVLGFHTGAKPVRLGAVAVVRLKSTFRHVISSI